MAYWTCLYSLLLVSLCCTIPEKGQSYRPCQRAKSQCIHHCIVVGARGYVLLYDMCDNMHRSHNNIKRYVKTKKLSYPESQSGADPRTYPRNNTQWETHNTTATLSRYLFVQFLSSCRQPLLTCIFCVHTYTKQTGFKENTVLRTNVERNLNEADLPSASFLLVDKYD